MDERNLVLRLGNAPHIPGIAAMWAKIVLPHRGAANRNRRHLHGVVGAH